MTAAVRPRPASPPRRLGLLLATWIAYWIAAFAIMVGPGIVAALHATNLPDKDVGTMSFSAGSSGFSLLVQEYGRTTWQGEVGLGAACLWVVAGPLVLTALWTWLGARRRRGTRGS